MDRNPFLKRLMKDTKSDVVHSSAYAKAQNAGGIGSASVQSFAERQAIESNRTIVKGYKDSRVVNDAIGSGRAEIKNYDAERDASQRAAIRDRFGGGRNAGNDTSGSVVKGNNTSVGGAGSSGRSATPPAWRNTGISR